LRCLECDHDVATFSGYKWKKSTDYMFLRNNYPNFSKLRCNLAICKSSRAFCCQCNWTDVKQPTRLDPRQFNWVCTKHPL
uniref:Cilia- and flagella-associated protein 418 n=1 Tax=Mesocestoides corti TaxID=53468 RepID=A0A0R3UKA0_MESCO